MTSPNEQVHEDAEIELVVETVADKQEKRLKVAGLCYCCCVVVAADDAKTVGANEPAKR